MKLNKVEIYISLFEVGASIPGDAIKSIKTLDTLNLVKIIKNTDTMLGLTHGNSFYNITMENKKVTGIEKYPLANTSTDITILRKSLRKQFPGFKSVWDDFTYGKEYMIKYPNHGDSIITLLRNFKNDEELAQGIKHLETLLDPYNVSDMIGTSDSSPRWTGINIGDDILTNKKEDK